MNIADMIGKLVPITRFNQGQASKYFMRANNGESFIVIKNNVPVSVIISPKEYILLRNIVSACQNARMQTDIELLVKASPLLEQLKDIEKEDNSI